MRHKQVQHALKMGSLVIKFLRGELTPAERLELETWLKEDGKNQQLLRSIFDDKLNKDDLKLAGQLNADQAFDRLIANIRQSEEATGSTIRTLRPFYKWTAAAAILLLVFTATLFIRTSKKEATPPDAQAAIETKAQKGADIILTLADGSTVNLEEQGKGVIATQGKSIITKQDSGLLSYTTSPTSSGNTAVAINTLETPRGKQYQLILPDGSKVWLNAQTTLRFPGSFSKTERIVELSGEAYFEIAGISASPFKVKTSEQTVEVLGTNFNISAYPEDRKTTTTLASGRVKVYDGSASCLLAPGQSAMKKDDATRFDIAAADLEETLGWKNGLLVLKDVTTEELMQLISRMYDIDVEMDERVKGRHFGGSYPIRNGLPNLLRNLEQTNVVHFKINGRKVNVVP